MPVGRTGTISLSPFYISDKPTLVGSRVVNTVTFTSALGIIWVNSMSGDSIAILMCSSGFLGIPYKLAKEVVLFRAKNIN